MAVSNDELTAELLELVQQLAALVEAEAWQMEQRLMKLAREGKLKVASWAPGKKKEWDSYVKVQDQQGQTVAFIDRGQGQVVESVDEPEIKESGADVVGDHAFLSPEENVALDFDSGRDELVNVGQAAWVVAREPVDEHHLPVGELVSDEQARAIAEGQLGWQWVDEQMDGLMAETRPTIVASEGVQVPDGVPVVVSGEWSWADEEPSIIDGEKEPVRSGEVTHGATVPVGTVAEQAVVDQQYHQFEQEEVQETSVSWSV